MSRSTELLWLLNKTESSLHYIAYEIKLIVSHEKAISQETSLLQESKILCWDFPGGSVVKKDRTSPAGGMGSMLVVDTRSPILRGVAKAFSK